MYRLVLLIGFLVVTAKPAPVSGQEVLTFREPRAATYRVGPAPAGFSATVAPAWITATSTQGTPKPLWLGSEVVLQLASSNELATLLAPLPLVLSEVLASNVFVLQAPDALAAARSAAALAGIANVLVSHPVRRRALSLHGGFAPRPNDPLFPKQWHLENRDTNTALRNGYDLNIRGAWPLGRGAGVTVAQGDDGMETDHPDLLANTSGAPHYDFFKSTTSGQHPSSSAGHGTAVAGLIAAQAEYKRGVVGVAPGARLASWVVFDSAGYYLSDTQSRRMFQYASNVVSVQNHSWGNADPEFLPLGVLESQGIGNTVTHGRSGRGVVIVRAAGNERLELNDANDDGYANDLRAITVGAVRNNGQVTSYSTPGACVLVAAFSADERVDVGTGISTNYPSLTTTDRRGSLGYNTSIAGGYPDYAFEATGFTGTSGSTPQISGLCALVLAANPTLSYRDVQQVLVLSARVLHPADPVLVTNGAGLRVSSNTGFGVPDAAQAVALARSWKNRPARQEVTVTTREVAAIPDDSLRVRITGPRVPSSLASIPAWPADGLHVDVATPVVPLVDVGLALDPIPVDLTGRSALVQRGQNYFVEKIRNVAAAGGRFVVMWNNEGTSTRHFIQGADVHFQPIPTVFLDQTSGRALQNYLKTAPEAQAQITLDPAVYNLSVSAKLQCEHVTLRVKTTHQRRGDLRVTLVSPAGTRSVLQHFNEDLSSRLDDWTYSTVHHFYEPSAGNWRVEISDERAGVTGNVTALDLTVTGVGISDGDRDGLDDGWELLHFGNLSAAPREDPDRDGANNLREEIVGTDPLVATPELGLELVAWDNRYWRLAWPTTPYASYRLEAAPSPAGPYQLVEALESAFAEAEWIVPADAGPLRFFRVQAIDPR